MTKYLIAILLALATFSIIAGPHYAGGKIKSASGSLDPHIMLEGSVTPTNCDGGSYGWMKFEGSNSTEKHQIYATALTAAISGKNVTVYTNSDGTTCKIRVIEVGIN